MRHVLNVTGKNLVCNILLRKLSRIVLVRMASVHCVVVKKNITEFVLKMWNI